MSTLKFMLVCAFALLSLAPMKALSSAAKATQLIETKVYQVPWQNLEHQLETIVGFPVSGVHPSEVIVLNRPFEKTFVSGRTYKQMKTYTTIYRLSMSYAGGENVTVKVLKYNVICDWWDVIIGGGLLLLVATWCIVLYCFGKSLSSTVSAALCMGAVVLGFVGLVFFMTSLFRLFG